MKIYNDADEQFLKEYRWFGKSENVTPEGFSYMMVLAYHDPGYEVPVTNDELMNDWAKATTVQGRTGLGIDYESALKIVTVGAEMIDDEEYGVYGISYLGQLGLPGQSMAMILTEETYAVFVAGMEAYANEPMLLSDEEAPVERSIKDYIRKGLEVRAMKDRAEVGGTVD